MSEALITPSMVLQALSRHIGERNGVHIRELLREIAGGGAQDDKYLERRIRKCVHELRDQGEHICGKPESGYFMAETPEELEATVQFLTGRALTSLAQAAAMKKLSLLELAGQLTLKT